MTLQETLEQDLKYLDRVCEGNLALKVAVGRLKITKIVIKPAYFPWPTSSTTISSNTIYLARNWQQWAPLDRRANLIHESTHLTQYRGISTPLWHTKYLLSEGFRAKMEIDACVEELRFYKQVGYQVDLQHFVHHLIDDHGLDKNRYFEIYNLFENVQKTF